VYDESIAGQDRIEQLLNEVKASAPALDVADDDGGSASPHAGTDDDSDS
jgi:hypothetical protein